MDKNDYGRRLANAISTQMRRKGITQEQLGRKIGVSQRTISDYASGKTAPSYDVMARMAVILDISLDQVFELKEDHAAVYLSKDESRLLDLISAASRRKETGMFECTGSCYAHASSRTGISCIRVFLYRFCSML